VFNASVKLGIDVKEIIKVRHHFCCLQRVWAPCGSVLCGSKEKSKARRWRKPWRRQAGVLAAGGIYPDNIERLKEDHTNAMAAKDFID
jgi:threonine aldolase